MTNKNMYRFATLAAATSLGLGVMLSGCGDSGSTEPAPLGKTGKVTFNYNVLAKAAANYKYETKIEKEIVNVRYAFYGDDFMDEATLPYKFEHQDKDQEQDIVVNNVNTKATRVVAAYYDEKGHIVALGDDEIKFANDEAVVSEPEVVAVDFNQEPPVLGVTKEIVPLKGKIRTAMIGKAANLYYDLTPFVEIKGLDNWLSKRITVYGGAEYEAIQYGILEPDTISATLNDKKYTVEDTIYITDQTPNKIKVIPNTIGDIIPFTDSEGTTPLILAGKDSLIGDKSTVDMTWLNDEQVEPRTMAVNKLPFSVFATSYTEGGDKGPQPKITDPIGIEITDDERVSVISQDPQVASIAKIARDSEEYFELSAQKAGPTVVSAEFNNGTNVIKSESTTDIKVEVVPISEEKLTFAIENGEIGHDTFIGDVKITASPMKADMFIAGLVSIICGESGLDTYVSEPLPYVASTYPDAEELSEKPKGTTYTKSEGQNKYELIVGVVAPTKDVEVTVKGANTLKPAFQPIYIKSN